MKENTSPKTNPSEFDILDVIKERASASSSGARPAATLNGDMEKEIEKQRAMELGPAVGKSLNSNGQTRAKERSISTAAAAADSATAATTRMCCTGDDGSTTMAPQKEENTIHAEESKMASGSGLPHKNGSSYAVKNQETNSAPEEVLDTLDVVRERQLKTDSSSLGIRYQKEMEKQKKNTKSHSNNKPTSNDVAGGAESLDTNKKMINNEQQSHNVAEQFDVMHIVHRRAALINNEESNGVAVVPEPPQQSGEGKRTINSIASQPGAYSGAPGEGLQRRDDMRFSLVGVLGDEVPSKAVLEDKTTEKDMGPPHAEDWSSSNAPSPPTERESFNDSFEIQAFAVDEEKAEEEMRKKIIQESVCASSVMVADNNHKEGFFAVKFLAMSRRRKLIAGFLLFLLLLVIALLLLLTNKSGGDSSGEEEDGLGNHTTTRQQIAPTLHRVRKRGYLNCGMEILPTLHFFDETGKRSGLNVALCKALAAAANVNATYVTMNAKDRFHALMNDTIDIMYSATDTMERRIHEVSTEIGFSFSSPYLHEGLRIAGDPFAVSCIETEKHWSVECSRFKLCVIAGTSHLDALLQILPKSQLEIVEDFEATVQGLIDKRCHAISNEGHNLQEKLVRDYGYHGNFSVGTRIFSKEPLCFLTRSGDPEWAAFVESVLQALLLAETHNITRSTAMLLPETTAFGDGYRRMHINAIGAGGNYGELYAKHVEPVIPRSRWNLINDNVQGPTGLMFSHPFGKADIMGVGSTYLGGIVSRGQVRCAMTLQNPGFATYTPDSNGYEGMEVDLCKALSVALFEGDPMRFEIVVVDDQSDGYASLEADSDIFAGATWNYQAMTKEKVNGKGYTFSMPYFYKNSGDDNEEDNRCLATSTQDHTWSSFVHVVVMGLIFAEEEGIGKENGNDMPEVNLFGPRYSRMLKDLVLAQGNYGHLYNMTLAKIVPRVGRNQINSLLNPGPQLYAIPGLIED